MQVFPDADARGSVASVFTIATDIHEDIVARDALIAARKRLDRFTENIPSPLTYLDRDARSVRLLKCTTLTNTTARAPALPVS